MRRCLAERDCCEITEEDLEAASITSRSAGLNRFSVQLMP
jgi:hypothetical protein